ncbi:AAA family ATPase [Mucilaginibacter celer]|uniref:ATPase AAA-type core domain-containing protein n=1 Tax=Mucilaginibacter celer TaxID=2305508 RepID=A0A494W098_9SPHI|nr:ATP-binding protein [Mucilaginibacter celer]AYL97173.1 hypothetical protein HYN43_018490 [Mucilaginibacter celer]
MPTNTDERPRVYLNKVHLKGYKSIEDVTIDFQKGLNILIGKNGAGKSNLLEMINIASRTRQGSDDHFTYAELEFVSDDEQTFEIKLEKRLKSKILDPENIDDRVMFIEKFSINGNVVLEDSDSENYKKQFDFKGRPITYKGSLRGLFISLGYIPAYPLYIKYKIPDNLDCITKPSSLKINYKGASLGIGEYPKTAHFITEILAVIEDFISNQNYTDFKDISKDDILACLKVQDFIVYNLKLFTPIENIRFSDNINLYDGNKVVVIDNIKLEFNVNNNWLPWSQLSDGTKRLFHIITEITYTSGLVLLEEPELGVHPHQFHLLMNFLKEQSQHKQIIISTHAPKALDHLNLDELNNILLVNYDQKKGTQLRHLTIDEQTKAQEYAKEVGYVSDYWMYSDLEE